jgi:predicted nucleic acid-binding protein
MARKPKKDKPIAYWDANLFCKFFNPEEEKWDDVNQALNKAKDGELLIVTSALTLAEVVKVNAELKLSPDQRQMVKALFEEPYIAVTAVTPITGEIARDLVWDFNIDPKDSVHVATAIERRVPVFHCYDGRLKKKGEKHVIKMLDFEMEFKEPLESFPPPPKPDFEQRKLDLDGQSADGNGRVQPSTKAVVEPKTEKPKRRIIQNF